jgi:hypothetical protein
LQDSTHYTPPDNVRAITNDLALLPAWYADEGDYVLINTPNPPPLSGCIPATLHITPLARKDIKAQAALLPRFKAAPWGLSRQSVRLFDDLRNEGLAVDGPVWKDEYKSLTSRRTAATCLAGIQQLLPGANLPLPPVFFSQPDHIEAWLHQHTGPFVLKAPYSSSGRGLLWINGNELSLSGQNRINGWIRKQNAVSIEQALHKETDFAMEFYSDGKGNLRYEGLSLFSTNQRGAYLGNKLQTQSALRKQLSNYTGDEALNTVQQALSRVLCDTFANCYTGYLGVDMLIYNDKGSFAIHPCVEINLRYTMGLTAIRLFENHLDPSAEGFFNVLYDRLPGRSYERHLLMHKAHPPVFRNGRLLRGYLSLCPVTPLTHYVACILAS